MTTEQPKSAPSQDQPYPPPMVAYPNPQFNGGTYPPPPAPPGTFQPHYFAFAPPDGSHGDATAANGVPPPGTPFVYPYPPGMLYAYPPTAPGFQVPQPASPIPSLKPKRKQVKMACTNCATACKRCDESRPCERCVKYGMTNTCVDGQRKERKKGIKRGPYKRKNKTGVNGDASSFQGTVGGEWSPGSAPPAAVASPVHAVPPFHAAAPEGFYPVYYPGFAPPAVQDGQNATDGTHPPQVVPLFIPGFPPYHYPPPGAVYAPPHAQPPAVSVSPSKKLQEDSPSVSPTDAASSQDNDSNGTTNSNSSSNTHDANSKPKKKQKSAKSGDHQKSKKVKSTTTRVVGAEEDTAESTIVNGNESST